MAEQPGPSRVIHGEYTSRGHRREDITVMPSGDLWIRGTLEGTLTVNQGGQAHIIGTLNGDLHLNGGITKITGLVTGHTYGHNT